MIIDVLALTTITEIDNAIAQWYLDNIVVVDDFGQDFISDEDNFKHILDADLNKRCVSLSRALLYALFALMPLAMFVQTRDLKFTNYLIDGGCLALSLPLILMYYLFYECNLAKIIKLAQKRNNIVEQKRPYNEAILDSSAKE